MLNKNPFEKSLQKPVGQVHRAYALGKSGNTLCVGLGGFVFSTAYVHYALLKGNTLVKQKTVTGRPAEVMLRKFARSINLNYRER